MGMRCSGGARNHRSNWKSAFLGNPQSDVSPSLFGLQVVVTNSISSGTFLLGSGSPNAAEIRDRLLTTIEVATQHSDDWIKNRVMFRVGNVSCLP